MAIQKAICVNSNNGNTSSDNYDISVIAMTLVIVVRKWRVLQAIVLAHVRYVCHHAGQVNDNWNISNILHSRAMLIMDIVT